jgi:protein-disulfide isomerase
MSKRTKMIARRRRQKRQRLLISAIVVIGAAVAIGALLIRPGSDTSVEMTIPESRTFPLVDGTSLGNPDAPVVIEEYSDFQCIYCRDFHQNTLEQIIDTYIATEQVRFEFHQFPILSNESVAAANASLCAAEQDRFWEYADLLFANQVEVGSGAFSSDRLLAFAETLDLDQDEFSRCVHEGRYASKVGMEYAAANTKGVNSPTTFFINGEIIHGPEPPPFADFQLAIESALQQTD